MTNKTLYVETDSLEFKEAKTTGWVRCIIGDAFDVDTRDAQYKGKRRQDFFARWDIRDKRDHSVHNELKRPVYRKEVKYIPPDGDVQSREVFEFKVNKTWTKSRMKQHVIGLVTQAVNNTGGDNVQSFDFIPTTWQQRAIEFIAESLDAGKTTLMLELAARFGKTGTLTQLFSYSDVDVMVVTNYVKTVNTSFADTVVKFFSDHMICLDAKDENFSDELKTAIDAGKKVLITCALFNGSKLDKAIRDITAIPNRFVVVDEADFGAHTARQRAKVEALRADVPLILMTGTNADRAASSHNIDAHLAVTYMDMLMECDN